jgi:NAD(P)-dependent dehydrogenase (short-subunit alcohol dehydrogenase family)
MNTPEGQAADQGFPPLLVASRALGWFVNPRGSVSERKLREAVSGKVVLVTGASYGIGEATARRLASAGATVLVVARSREKLESLCAEIRQRGGDAYAYPTDLADPDSVDALAAQVLERHGQVDVIVNNAGKSIRRSIELSYERFHDFQRTIDVNYLGPVKLLLALLPSMRERGQGHIVNVSTVGVRIPPAPYWAAYQASKSAFDVFLRTVAVEAAADGVTTTSVYMVLVHTRMSAPTPVFRYVPGLTPEEAAGLVCKAIVERPKVISPWWAGAAEAGFALTRRPWELASGFLARRTSDTKAAVSSTQAERTERPRAAVSKRGGGPGE